MTAHQSGKCQLRPIKGKLAEINTINRTGRTNMGRRNSLWQRPAGRPDLASDPRFRTFKERLANREQITATLDAALEARTTAEWLEHFAGRVPAAPVNDIASALNNPFVREKQRIWNIPHPARPDFKMVAAPFTVPARRYPRTLRHNLARTPIRFSAAAAFRKSASKLCASAG